MQRSTLHYWRLLLGVACLSWPLHASAQSAAVTVHIPAKPIGEALIDFAVQAKLSVSESGLDFHNARSNPVDGTFAQSEALKRLLAHSGFDFEFVDASTVRIRLAAVPAKIRPQRYAIENVVVTATKREELAQNLPYSIAVTTQQQLEGFGVNSSHDLTSQVAGLTATNLGPGEDKLFVRGLTDSVLPGLSESMVGLYLDETRIADDAPDPNLRLIDIDRVEILRGPQGSLYGAGSLAGLVRIITRKPVMDEVQMMAGASVAATENGGMSTGYDGMLNIPLVRNRLALRVVGYIDEIGGYVDNIRLHRTNTNRSGVRGARAALGWHPNRVWTIAANFTLQNIKAQDSQYYLQQFGPQRRDNFLLEPHSDRMLLAGITASASFAGADLVSNTSFVDRHLRNRFDASLAWPDLTGFPISASPFDFARNIQSFTHETRLASTRTKHWQWLVGLFLSHRDEDFESNLTGPDTTGTDVLARMEAREDRADEAALFGEVTYDFTKKFSLTAGARVFNASHTVSAHSSGFLIGTPLSFNGSNTQIGAAPKLVLKYQPVPNTTFYAQFSEGYRLGGFNVDGPLNATGESENNFDSDVLRNYELGTKMSLFHGFAVTNAALYFAVWQNVQTDQIAPNGAFFIVNAGTVRDLGVEFDATLQPLRNLRLQGNFFWNNANLSGTNPILLASEGGLPGAPDISFGISGRYDFSIGARNTGFLSASYAYVGSSHLGFSENTPSMGNYHLANLRIGVERDGWQAVIFMNNLTNEAGNTFAFGNPFNLDKEMQITPPQPRTIGLSLIWTR